MQERGGGGEQFVFVWHSSHYQLSVGLHSLTVTHAMEAKASINGMSNVRPITFPARVRPLDRVGQKYLKVTIFLQ